jgi:HEAT repeat protein
MALYPKSRGVSLGAGIPSVTRKLVEYMLQSNGLHKHIQAVLSGDGTSRRQAILYLKEQEEQHWAGAASEVIHPLVQALQQQLLGTTKQPVFRQEVATLLGNLGPHSEPAIPELIELLQDGIPDRIRGSATIALGKIGKEAKNHSGQKVRNALVALWLAPGHTKYVHVRVANALCRMKVDASGLLTFLTTTVVADQDCALRISAAEVLAWRGKNEFDVVPALLTAALTDKSDEVRQAAEASLDRLGLSRKKCIDLCAKQLGESVHAETALRSCGELAVSGLIKALQSEETKTREKALRTLGGLGELAQAATAEITKALQDRDLFIRLAAAKSLWNITKKADVAVPALVDLLNRKQAAARDADETRRRFLQTVMEALRRIGPFAQEAIPALIEKTKDKNRMISESALSALKQIAPTGFVQQPELRVFAVPQVKRGGKQATA